MLGIRGGAVGPELVNDAFSAWEMSTNARRHLAGEDWTARVDTPSVVSAVIKFGMPE